jgi:hypothetical protein
MWSSLRKIRLTLRLKLMSKKNALACCLQNQDFRIQANASKEILKLARSTEEIEGGFRFSFDASSNSLRLLCELIDAERQCCPFLIFTLEVPAHQNAFVLRIAGPSGTVEFIRSHFLT